MNKNKKGKSRYSSYLGQSFDIELCLLRRLTHRHADCNKKIKNTHKNTRMIREWRHSESEKTEKIECVHLWP